MANNTAFQVGDILRHSWGYEQTNVDFWQVVRVSAHNAWIRRIADDRIDVGPFQGNTRPRPDEFLGEPQRRKIQWYDGKPFLYFDYGVASKTDKDTPVHYSWGH